MRRNEMRRVVTKTTWLGAVLAGALLAGCHLVDGASPNPAPPGAQVTISGNAFGDEQGGVWLLDLTRGSIDVAVRSDELFSIYPIWRRDGRSVEVATSAAPRGFPKRGNNGVS